MRTFALIGGGQASAVAARTLRRRGFDGRIVLIGDEPTAPYQRPPLSKEYLAEADDEGLYLLAQDWCEQNSVELLLGRRAQRLADGVVELDDGSRFTADAVLIATGGSARRMPGVDSERVFYLRTVADADRLRERLVPGAHVIVVGAGFIGAEVAATARGRGAEVTMVESFDVPLQRVLGREVGAACAELHRGNGVELRFGCPVESIADCGDSVVVTVAGERLRADLVVVGIGIVPNIDLAVESGIAVDNGILVDAQCRTSQPTVFAAGDVANHDHPLFGERVRVEHFDNANKQAAAAANAMLGRTVSYDDPHWFWSDQYDSNLQYAGHAPTWDELVIRGSIDELDFSAFYLRDGMLRAAFGFDRGGDVLIAKELIAGGVSVDPAVLRDEDVDLAELMALEEEL